VIVLAVLRTSPYTGEVLYFSPLKLIYCVLFLLCLCSSGPVGKWENLNYSLKVREDSTIRFTVSSCQTVIGSIQMDPKWIASHPISSEGIVELVTEIYNPSRSSVGKLIIVLFCNVNEAVVEENPNDNRQYFPTFSPHHVDSGLQWVGGGSTVDYSSASGYPMLSVSDPVQNGLFTGPGRPMSANTSHLLFDRNLLSSPADSSVQQNGTAKVSFRVDITEIDLWDLKPMHAFSLVSSAKNCPQVSLACGKVSCVSPVHESAGSSCYWTGLKWSFPVNDQATRLRLIVTSRKCPLGYINFTVDQLINALTENENIKRVRFIFLQFLILFSSIYR
jgi:hypothetical protein